LIKLHKLLKDLQLFENKEIAVNLRNNGSKFKQPGWHMNKVIWELFYTARNPRFPGLP
jgi:hypothetical protein